MKVKIIFTFCLLLWCSCLLGQAKIYLTPHVNCFLPSYKGVDSVNNKQSFIKTKSFLRKDFLVGINVANVNGPFAISLGIEEGVFSSAYYRHEERNTYPRVDSKETISDGALKVYYTDLKYNLVGFNLKKPKKWRQQPNVKDYLLVSRFHPILGIEMRRMNKSFVQDFPESS